MTVGGNLGDLRGKFIMDRNLGARNTKFADDGIGNLYYQFGRKDPFAGGNTNASSATSAYIGRRASTWTLDVEKTTAGLPVSYAVNRPMLKIGNSWSTWCSDVQSERYIWHDADHDIDSNGKSIFDPSPFGWKVTANGTVDGFSLSTTTMVLGVSGAQNGLSYPAEDPIAFYPAAGAIGSDSANLVVFATSGVYCHSTPSTTTLSFLFNFASSTVEPSNGTAGRSTARSVRCVQHDESKFGN